MNKHLLSLAALLAATALIAAGCGGSDDSSDSDEPAPTQAAYITEADAICAADAKTIQGLQADLPSNDINDPAVQEIITNEVLPVYQEQLTKLRELTPPEGDEDATAAIYDELDTALQAIEDDPAAIGDQSNFTAANDLANEYGLTECGS